MAYEIIEYSNEADVNLFREWFFSLYARAAAKVTTAIARLENGNTSNVKSVGSAVYEYKINFGPGYRIYFAYDGKTSLSCWPAVPKRGNLKILRPPRRGRRIMSPERR